VTDPQNSRTSPTVILIGGQMVTDDGTRLDSRQPIEGDHRSEVILRSLATSLLWWRSASSVVSPILDNAGSKTFALLICTKRTVVELGHDGNLQHTRLSAFLRGGTTTTELTRVLGSEQLPDDYEQADVLHDWYYGHYIGTIGVKPGTPSARWRFLRNEYYLAHAIGMLHPAAIIDTTTDALSGLFHSDRGVTASEKINGKIGNRFHGLEKTRLAFDDAVLVMPHTHAIEAFLTSYSEWVAAGRPSTASESEDDSWLRPLAALTSSGSYDAAIDPLQRALPVPIEADFRVTGLMENAQWRDASHLEASRELLQARYDLKIGIWDLARNPILRQTLLDANPIAAAPDSATAMPSSARQRAEGHVNATLANRAAKREIWDSMLAGLQPLIQMGWDPIDKYGRHWHLRLPLTQTFFDGYYSNDGEPIPLAVLSWTFGKRKNTVAIEALRGPLVGFEDYFRSRRDLFEAIAGTGRYPLGENKFHEIWTDTVGWGDDAAWGDWAADVATRTTRWIEAFAPMRDVYERVYSKKPTSNDIASLPALWRQVDGSIRLTAPVRGIRQHDSAETLAALTEYDSRQSDSSTGSVIFGATCAA
jgi:hypothetical protein